MRATASNKIIIFTALFCSTSIHTTGAKMLARKRGDDSDSLLDQVCKNARGDKQDLRYLSFNAVQVAADFFALLSLAVVDSRYPTD